MALDEKTQARLMALLDDRQWRLDHLYQVLAADGKVVPFRARAEQRSFRANRHTRNFVPKARKLGISTEIVIENGDECLFKSNLIAGIIDKTEEDAWAKLQIFRLAWEKGPEHPEEEIAWLWTQIQAANPLSTNRASEMGWRNGAVFRAGVSFIGRTPQRLHISEFGPIAAQFPGRAAEIQRGSVNSVEPGGIIDIETTMEGGRAGLCYHYFTLAKDAAGTDLSEVEWRMHFFSWLGHPAYRLPGRRPQHGGTTDYFRTLREKYNVTVSDEQQAWWEARRREQGDEMWQQYPTVIDEADKAMVAGCIYPEMTAVRVDGRVTTFNPVPGLPLFSAWDLGSSDNMAGWLLQPAGRAHNVLAWVCGEGQGAAGVAGVIREWEREFGRIAIHLLPHDANIHDKGSGKTYLQQLLACGIPATAVRVVPRTPDVWAGIDEVRKRLPNTWFHVRCDVKAKAADGSDTPSGVTRLEGYRKRVNASTGIVTSMPVKDGLCDHSADALRTYAEADAQGMIHAAVQRPPPSEHDWMGRPVAPHQPRALTAFRR